MSDFWWGYAAGIVATIISNIAVAWWREHYEIRRKGEGGGRA